MMKVKAELCLAALACALAGGVLGCNDRTQTGPEGCFYVDPGYWIDPGGVTRWCDDIDRDPPEPPAGAMAIGVIARHEPNDEGTCDLCPEAELDLDVEFSDAAKEHAETQHRCSADSMEILETIRQCVSPPEQTSEAPGGGELCWYRATVFFECHDDG